VSQSETSVEKLVRLDRQWRMGEKLNSLRDEYQDLQAIWDFKTHELRTIILSNGGNEFYWRLVEAKQAYIEAAKEYYGAE
jgi:hypothetical protein